MAFKLEPALVIVAVLLLLASTRAARDTRRVDKSPISSKPFVVPCLVLWFLLGAWALGSLPRVCEGGFEQAIRLIFH